jgi:hypothetical protein
LSTKTVYAQAETGADLYLRVFNEAGLWLDFDDDEFKAWASATTPYLAMTEDALLGGTNRTNYAATIDLATLNETPEPQRFYLQCCDNGTPALADDPVTETIEIVVQAGEVAGSDDLVCMVDGCFTSTAGTEMKLLAWLEKNGQKVTLTTASCTVTVREHGAGANLFSVTDAAPNAAGIFELTQASPGFTDDREYLVTVAITVNTIVYTTTHGLQVQSA